MGDVDTDGIANAIFGHMKEDETLTDDDRKEIVVKLGEKIVPPEPKDDKPWTEKKMW